MINSYVAKQYPSFSSPINEKRTIAAYTTTDPTLTVADVLGGFITSSNAAAQTVTLPDASALVPQIQGAEVGSCIRFIVKELGAGTATVAAGVGGTIEGTATIATANLKEFLLMVTAVGDADGNGATYTAYSLGTVAF